MIQFRGFVTAATIVTITASCFFLKAQTAASPSKFDLITLNIALDKDNFSVGQSPRVVLTMNSRHVFALSLIGAVTASCISFASQTAIPANQSSTIYTSLAITNDTVPIGKSPQVIFTVKNISASDVSFPTAQYNYRVHVEGKEGEPPLTKFHRHQRGIYLPGDTGAVREGGVTLDIAPGASQSRTFDLSRYYEFSVPGKYTAYVEYLDESGKWLRTNTVQFEIVQANQ